MLHNTYIIVPTSEITDTMVKASLNHPEAIRYSTDGSKAILKFDTIFPDAAKGYIKYNHDQILDVLKTAEWTPAI